MSKQTHYQIDIGIPDKKRKEIADGLSSLLADSYTLYLATHNFHWNVTGPMFQTLHLMFMEQYTQLWQALDEIAERIRSLGHWAPGTYAQFAEMTSISEPKGIPKATEMLEFLVGGHQAVAKTARSILETAEEGNDEVTLDLLTQRLQYHEKTAWMLRSLLET